MIHITQI